VVYSGGTWWAVNGDLDVAGQWGGTYKASLWVVHGDWDVVGSRWRLGRHRVGRHVRGVVVGGPWRLGHREVVTWHVRGIVMGGSWRWDVVGGVWRLGCRERVTWHIRGVAVGGAQHLRRGGARMRGGGARTTRRCGWFTRLGHGGWCTTIGRSQSGDVARTRDRRGWCMVIGTWWVVYDDWEVAGW